MGLIQGFKKEISKQQQQLEINFSMWCFFLIYMTQDDDVWVDLFHFGIFEEYICWTILFLKFDQGERKKVKLSILKEEKNSNNNNNHHQRYIVHSNNFFLWNTIFFGVWYIYLHTYFLTIIYHYIRHYVRLVRS